MYELLAGIRIIDLTTTFLGPYATQMLGDMGAEIVKVEPLEGDVGRFPRPNRSPDMGAGFMNANRNKRSIAIDLKAPEGRAILLKLVAGADGFVHNMRAKAAEKLGLDYGALKRTNAGLVYCYAPGFGQDGPNKDEPAYDDIIQAMSGLAHLNADASGQPRFVPTIVADRAVGLHLAFALSAGLAHRFKTGEGALIEVPMFESMIAFLMIEHLSKRSFVPAQGPAGYERMLAKNRRPYRTKDGYVAIMPYTSQQWTRFLECVGRSELLAEDWVKDPVQRSANVDALYQIIIDAAPGKTSAEWLALMKERDIPCGPANTLEDLFADPHLTAVGLFEAVSHPTEGALTQVRSPFRVTGAARRPDRPAPALGEGSESILAEAGYSQREIEEFLGKGIVRAAAPKREA